MSEGDTEGDREGGRGCGHTYQRVDRRVWDAVIHLLFLLVLVRLSHNVSSLCPTLN